MYSLFFFLQRGTISTRLVCDHISLKYDAPRRLLRPVRRHHLIFRHGSLNARKG